jgi:phosphoglycolate phosphatase-like HAD superfamily hydrolase
MKASLDITRVRALCLDIDGTMADSDDHLVDQVTRLLTPFRFLFRDQDPSKFARRIVMAAETPFNAAVVLADRIGLDNVLIPLMEKLHGPTDGKPEAQLIDGVRPALDALRQRFPLSVVTARAQYSTDSFLDYHALRSHFKCVATARTCHRAKPHPAPLLWAAEQMKIPAEACLMVGDTPIDIQTGVAAGAQTIGVLCGFGNRDELMNAGANLILESTADLPAILDGAKSSAP